MPVDPAKPFDLLFKAGPAHTGSRLDLFVKAMLPSMSRTRIQLRALENRIVVNDHPRPSNWRVRAGDVVVLRVKAPDDDPSAAFRVPLDIVYEDDRLAAVNKPPGALAHPVGRHRHDTILNALYMRYRDRLPPEADLSLVNRLDQYTSGLMLAALDAKAKRFLQEEFEARNPEKIYGCLCEGLPAADAGEIDLPLGRDPSGRDPCRMAVLAEVRGGKPSFTRYEVLERFPAADCAWVRLRPATGRQHQLRVHMAAIGRPLLCDARYGEAGPAVFADAAGGPAVTLARCALHAERLRFRHPSTGAAMTVEAPTAADLVGVLAALRRGATRPARGETPSGPMAGNRENTTWKAAETRRNSS